MANKSFTVQWEQGGSGSVKPSRISTVVNANSRSEALSKIKSQKQTTMSNTKFSNWSAFENKRQLNIIAPTGAFFMSYIRIVGSAPCSKVFCR